MNEGAARRGPTGRAVRSGGSGSVRLDVGPTDQREIDRRAQELRPVFIVGAPRSGTSLLYRTLQRHPSFRVPNASEGMDLQESDIVAHLENLPWFNRERPRTLVRFLLGDVEHIDAFLASIRPLAARVATLRTWDRRLTDLTRGRVEVHLPRRPARFDRVVRNFFVVAHDARGPQRLVEKTPHHVAHLDLFRAAFPRARFLYIHRHPVDVYSSYRRRGEIDERAEWARLSPPEFVDLHGRMSRLAADEADRADDLLLVSYERFVREPEACFRRVCDFLEEPFVPEALTLEEEDPSRWRIDPHLFQSITTSTKDWRDHISEEDAAVVETGLADVIARWGYDPYVPPERDATTGRPSAP